MLVDEQPAAFAGDAFELRVRVGTAVTGALVAQSPVDPTDGRTIGYRYLEIPLVGSAAWSSLHLSVVRTSGTGTLSYYGSTQGRVRSWAALWDVGDTDNWTDVP